MQLETMTLSPLPSTSLSSWMMALFGFNLRVFLFAMYDDIDESCRVFAFMIRSMLDDQPVTSTQGESVMWFEMMTSSLRTSLTMALFGFNSRVFLLAMYDDVHKSRRAFAFMIHSMLDNQLN